MTETTDTPKDIFPLLQQLRDSFDEIVSTLQNDERCVRQEWDKLQEERDRMMKDIMQLHLQPGSSTSPIKSALYRAPMPPAAAEEGAGAHEQLPGASKSNGLVRGDTHDKKGCATNASVPIRRESDIWKGLRSEIVDIRSPLCGGGDNPKRRPRTDSGQKTISSVLLSSQTHLEERPTSGHTRSPSACVDYGDESCIMHTNPPSGGGPLRHRATGITSTLNQARLRAVPPSVTPARGGAYAESGRRNSTQSALQGRTFWINVWPCFGTFASSVCKPKRIVVHGSYCYMEQLTEKAGIETGCRPAPSVLYEPDGRPIRSLVQLMPEQHYLLFPSGGFYRKEAVPAALLMELVRAARTTLQNHSVHHER
ncbi:hypothetical protein DQ04_00091100 [Trypanosoma grayi]|uniref:hypothetical protein n=1 Tax=Trypanosoma grayi TaxID=71804 RepID=UPI0004F49BB4|nr:hypothetical protein DQ04_00091100 [Trypanosoma grayi]KEG15376.1 hypothetical protein DQ04_00091100 [Trypanosoma grayi]